MRTFLLIPAVVLGCTLCAAEEGWDKLGELKTGTELRVYKRGTKQPMTARFAEASPERLMVIVKDEQTSVAREEIDRVDYRPQSGLKLTRENKSSVNVPAEERSGPRPGPAPETPRTSTSSGFSISKPGFETIYRRAGSPASK